MTFICFRNDDEDDDDDENDDRVSLSKHTYTKIERYIAIYFKYCKRFFFFFLLFF